MTTKIIHNLEIKDIVHDYNTGESFPILAVFPNVEITYDETKITEDQIPVIVYDKIRAFSDKDDVLVKFLIEDAN